MDTETVFVDLTKDEIKKAPEFDEKTYWGEAYKSDLGDYYIVNDHNAIVA